MKLRTLDTAMDEIKQLDPHTSLTRYALRQAVLEGRIPCVMVGKKRLIDVSRVLAYFANAVESEVRHDGN